MRSRRGDGVSRSSCHCCYVRDLLLHQNSFRESPLFSILKRPGRRRARRSRRASAHGALEGFFRGPFGATAGQAVVWYTGQFTRCFSCKWFSKSRSHFICLRRYRAHCSARRLFVFFGSLSDRIGRKKIMMAGNLLAALLYVPIYHGMKFYSNPVNAVRSLRRMVFVQVVFVHDGLWPIARPG